MAEEAQAHHEVIEAPYCLSACSTGLICPSMCLATSPCFPGQAEYGLQPELPFSGSGHVLTVHMAWHLASPRMALLLEAYPSLQPTMHMQ